MSTCSYVTVKAMQNKDDHYGWYQVHNCPGGVIDCNQSSFSELDDPFNDYLIDEDHDKTCNGAIQPNGWTSTCTKPNPATCPLFDGVGVDTSTSSGFPMYYGWSNSTAYSVDSQNVWCRYPIEVFTTTQAISDYVTYQKSMDSDWSESYDSQYDCMMNTFCAQTVLTCSTTNSDSMGTTRYVCSRFASTGTDGTLCREEYAANDVYLDGYTNAMETFCRNQPYAGECACLNPENWIPNFTLITATMVDCLPCWWQPCQKGSLVSDKSIGPLGYVTNKANTLCMEGQPDSSCGGVHCGTIIYIDDSSATLDGVSQTITCSADQSSFCTSVDPDIPCTATTTTSTTTSAMGIGRRYHTSSNSFIQRWIHLTQRWDQLDRNRKFQR